MFTVKPIHNEEEYKAAVLNRKRNLTLKMIKNLYHGLGIPANVLLSV